jgi:inner membrane protein
MDVFTQTLTGALFAQAVMAPRLGRVAAAMGAVGGVLADADVLLAPLSDPSMHSQLHRHFTHALLFIPVGGAIAAAPFLAFRRWRRQAVAVYAATTVGYATHGLLDNLTSYGTHLLWPFTSQRTAWDVISIIDPIYTGVLFVGVMLALALGKAAPARVAAVLALCYIGLGFAQHHRASVVQQQLATARGHRTERGRVMPTFGNTVLWRSVYEYDGRLYADAIHLVPFGATHVKLGESIDHFAGADLPSDAIDPQRITKVFESFSKFTDGYTAATVQRPSGTTVIGDMRYSFDTAGFAPIWGLRIDPYDPVDPTMSVGFTEQRRDAVGQTWRDLVEPGDEFQPVQQATMNAAQP